MLSNEEEADLRDLAWHWEDAYEFRVVDGVWQAIPAGDPAGLLTADAAWELREKVRADYAAHKAAAQSTQAHLQERMST
jgi:nitroimidazol reductase NimA-like FMN-containing flavoprotein (pyridoxamine 5'-phosphate oxidase superfamily)